MIGSCYSSAELSEKCMCMLSPRWLLDKKCVNLNHFPRSKVSVCWFSAQQGACVPSEISDTLSNCSEVFTDLRLYRQVYWKLKTEKKNCWAKTNAVLLIWCQLTIEPTALREQRYLPWLHKLKRAQKNWQLQTLFWLLFQVSAKGVRDK